MTRAAVYLLVVLGVYGAGAWVAGDRLEAVGKRPVTLAIERMLDILGRPWYQHWPS